MRFGRSYSPRCCGRLTNARLELSSTRVNGATISNPPAGTPAPDPDSAGEAATSANGTNDTAQVAGLLSAKMKNPPQRGVVMNSYSVGMIATFAIVCIHPRRHGRLHPEPARGAGRSAFALAGTTLGGADKAGPVGAVKQKNNKAAHPPRVGGTTLAEWAS